MRRNGRSLAMAAALFFAAATAVAQDSAAPPVEPPIATIEAAARLGAALWQPIEPGLEVLTADAGHGARVFAFRISPEKFRFEIAVQTQAGGERVGALGERNRAVLAVNGGFFGETESGGLLFPVGLLRVKGRNLGQVWPQAGGFLALGDDEVRIVPSRDGPPREPRFLIQSKPMLIEPGGMWAMNSNSGPPRPRTLICRQPDGEVVLAVVHGLGLNLFEAGWLLRARGEGGYFGCDAAIALDGGGSTQLWVSGRDDLAVDGETPVHNALLVRRR